MRAGFEPMHLCFACFGVCPSCVCVCVRVCVLCVAFLAHEFNSFVFGMRALGVLHLRTGLVACVLGSSPCTRVLHALAYVLGFFASSL